MKKLIAVLALSGAAAVQAASSSNTRTSLSLASACSTGAAWRRKSASPAWVATTRRVEKPRPSQPVAVHIPSLKDREISMSPSGSGSCSSGRL